MGSKSADREEGLEVQMSPPWPSILGVRFSTFQNRQDYQTVYSLENDFSILWIEHKRVRTHAHTRALPQIAGFGILYLLFFQSLFGHRPLNHALLEQ